MRFQKIALLISVNAAIVLAQPYGTVTGLPIASEPLTPVGVNSTDIVVGAGPQAGAPLVLEGGSTVNTGYQSGVAVAVNDSGTVLVDTYLGSIAFKRFRAATWNNGTATLLGAYPSATGTWGAAINSLGDVAGIAYFSTAPQQAFLLTGGGFTALGTLPGYAYASAVGINDSDQIAGTAYGSSPNHAFLFQSGALTDLGVLPNTYNSYATGINDSSVVVGYCYDGLDNHAFVYSSGGMTSLGTLPGDAGSVANSINGAGTIVGTSIGASGQSRGFVYRNGVIYDLNSLVPPNSGWMLSTAAWVSNNDDVVGDGTYNGTKMAFLLHLPYLP